MRELLLYGLIVFFLALPSASQADQINKRLPVAAGQQIEIDIRTGGPITIRGGEESAATVSVERADRDAGETEVVFEPTAGGVRLTSRYLVKKQTYSADLKFEVRVPHHFNVRLHSMGGPVHLEDLDGSFRGVTMGGELQLSRLDGDVELKTMGGNIRVAKSRLDGSVTTNGGNIEFDEVAGAVQGHSLGGQVTYHDSGARQPHGEGAGASSDGPAGGSGRPVVISSMGGDLRVEAAPNGADLKTMGGNVRVRTAAKFVKALTMGGDIVIEHLDGSVDASTMAGDITVAMASDPSSPTGGRTAKLDSKSGDLHLAVPANLPMDIDIELFYTRDSRRNYQVHSDFALQTEESSEWDTSHGAPRKLIHATGRQGAATNRIELRTINGDVYLTRAQ